MRAASSANRVCSHVIVEAHSDVAGYDPDLDRRLLAACESMSAHFGEGFTSYHPPRSIRLGAMSRNRRAAV